MRFHSKAELKVQFLWAINLGKITWITHLCRLGHVAVIVLGISCGTLAAEDRPRELFQFGAGASYMRGDWIPQNRNYGGFIFTAGWTQNQTLRWKFDGGFNFAGSSIQQAPVEGVPAEAMASLSQMLGQFHAGPEITRRRERSTLFAHVLPGYTNWSLGFFGLENRSTYTSTGGFSLEAGGGIDFPMRRHLDIRLQADYVPSWPKREPSSAGLSAPLPAIRSLRSDFRVSMFFIGTVDRAERSPEESAAIRSKLERYQVGAGLVYNRLSRWPGHANWAGFFFAGNWTQTRRLRWAGEATLLSSGSPVIDKNLNARIDQWAAQVHAGPEFTRASQRAILFGHVLPGYTFWRLNDATGQSVGVGEGGFSLAAGGGTDLYISRQIDLRLQADYIATWLDHTAVNTLFDQPIPRGDSPYAALRLAVVVLKTGTREKKP